MFIMFRPDMRKMLKKLSQEFELILFTSSIPEYANAAKAKCGEQGLYPQVLILCVIEVVVAVVARRARVVVVSTQQQQL